jgi:hypothetical protein
MNVQKNPVITINNAIRFDITLRLEGLFTNFQWSISTFGDPLLPTAVGGFLTLLLDEFQ